MGYGTMWEGLRDKWEELRDKWEELRGEVENEYDQNTLCKISK